MGFSQGTGPILFGYLDCNGTEADLVECTQNYNNTHTYCQSHYYDVAIVCKSKYLNILNISISLNWASRNIFITLTPVTK